MTLVVDASVVLAWLLPDERGWTPEASQDHAENHGAWVPSLWRLEVANALRVAIRRKRCSEIYANQALQRLGQFDIRIDSETDLHAWGATHQLSRRYDLTLYDAAYLELAIRLELPLASLDAELLAAARKARVETIDG